jgi:hypothetical protein
MTESGMMNFLFFPACTRLSHFAMLLSKHRRRRYVCNRRLDFILHAADNVPFAVHQSIEAIPSHLRRIVLVLLSDFGVHHIGAAEEFRVGRARHEAGDSYFRILELIAEGEREGIEECFGAIINGLERARHEPGDRTCDENFAGIARSKVTTYFLNEIYGPNDIGIHDPFPIVPVLVKEGAA